MIPYILRRLLSLLPVLWAVVTLIWICVFLLPGDPARLLAGGQRSDPAVVARIRAEWGLDDPPALQYLRYLAGLVRGNLGTSYLQGRPVARVDSLERSVRDENVRRCVVRGPDARTPGL